MKNTMKNTTKNTAEIFSAKMKQHQQNTAEFLRATSSKFTAEIYEAMKMEQIEQPEPQQNGNLEDIIF